MISKQFSRLRAETARKTDIRIGIMNEIIDGIKVIKMYAWEHAFAKSIGDARRYLSRCYSKLKWLLLKEYEFKF